MTLPLDDRGFTLGDGLFETILADNGRLMLWEEHMARLTAGCGQIGLPAPCAEAMLVAACEALADAGLAGSRAAVRITWTAGSGGRGLDRPRAPSPRLEVTVAAATAPVGPAALITVSTRRNDGSIASRLKTLSYLDNVLARREASAAAADEAVMLNTLGQVACAAAANLFWERDGRLYTPAIACGVLPGIVRAAALATARGLGVAAEEMRADAGALADCDAAFITNSLVGVRAVSSMDGRPLADSRLTQQLAQATVWDLRGRR